MHNIDLHTHSTASPDGALRRKHYSQMLERGALHTVAVTDHNTIEHALKLQETLGDQVIVGEEVTAQEGEVIGLYLKEAVAPGLSAAETVKAIRAQGGLVYIPHPFETVRKGLSLEVLDAIADKIDIVEVHNGRAVFQNHGEQAREWAERYGIAAAASSDAHGRIGWGRTYSLLTEKPTKESLVDLLKKAEYEKGMVGFLGILYPKFNRIRKKFGHA